MKTSVILGLLIAVIMSSCRSSIVIASNKATEFDEKISSIFFLNRGSEIMDNYLGELMTNLAPEFAKRNIKMSYGDYDPLSLKSDEKTIRELGKTNDVIMTIQLVEGKVGRTNFFDDTPRGANFDLKLYKPGQEEMVWRGAMSIENIGYRGLESAAKESAQELITRLIEDGIIE